MTSAGPPYISYPATRSTILSAPTSLGLNLPRLIPVLIPGPTMIGFTSKYLIKPLLSECMIFGTTDPMIAAFTSPSSNPFSFNRFEIRIPNSSDVLGNFVVIRNTSIISFLLNTPIVILVFPTSSANNIIYTSSSPKRNIL